MLSIYSGAWSAGTPSRFFLSLCGKHDEMMDIATSSEKHNVLRRSSRTNNE